MEQLFPIPEQITQLPTKEFLAPICFTTHDFPKELGIFDQKRPLSDLDFAIELRGVVRHAYSLTHRRNGQMIYGIKVTPQVLENASRTQFEERGLREVLILLFSGRPRKALEFVYSEVAEQARQEARLAIVEALPPEQRGPRPLDEIITKPTVTDVDQVPNPRPSIEDINLLVQAAKGGDSDAYGQIYGIYSDQVYRHIFYRVSTPQDAEDLTSQVFLNAWRAIPRYQDRGKPPIVWFLNIAHNLVVDYYRAHRPQSSLEDVIIPSGDREDPVLSAERNFASKEVRQAILRLKRDQQQVVILRFIDGLEYPDIAAIMGKREGATRVILHRSLMALREMLKDGGVAAEYLGES